MISTLEGGVERDFILGLADDLKGYVVLDCSLKKYFDESSNDELAQYFTDRKRIILSDEFMDLIGDTSSLVKESHEIKRRSTRQNVRLELPYHLRNTGGEVVHRRLIEENRILCRKIKAINGVQFLGRFTETEGLNYSADELSALSPHESSLRTDFAKARSISLRNHTTILTYEPDVVELYVTQQNRELAVGKRFEVLLIHPGEKSFSYFYPGFVNSRAFAEARAAEMVEAA